MGRYRALQVPSAAALYKIPTHHPHPSLRLRGDASLRYVRLVPRPSPLAFALRSLSSGAMHPTRSLHPPPPSLPPRPPPRLRCCEPGVRSCPENAMESKRYGDDTLRLPSRSKPSQPPTRCAGAPPVHGGNPGEHLGPPAGGGGKRFDKSKIGLDQKTKSCYSNQWC